MAVAPWVHTITLEDGKAQKGTVTAYSDHATEALALTASNELRNAVVALSGMALREHTLSRIVVSGTDAPASGSDREEKGSFNFRDADGRAVIMSIPGFLEVNVIAGTKNINTSALTVSDFTSAVIDGGFTSNRAIDIVALNSAVEKFTASNNKK